MAKVHHLKNKKGVSFTVTNAGLKELKENPKWRQEYDYVGEVDEDEFASQSESAQKVAAPVVAAEKKTVKKGEKEESSKDIFAKNAEAEAKAKKEADEKEFNEQFENAQNAFKNKDYENALVAINKCIDLDSENEEAVALKAKINKKLK